MSRHIALVMLLFGLVSSVYSQEWVGKTVFARNENTPLRSETMIVSEFTFDAKVLKEDGEWVEVRHNMESPTYPHSYQGFVQKKDVVPAEEAVAYFTGMINANPSNTWAYLSRAKAWQLNGEDDVAIRDISEALRRRPEAWVFNIRGIAWHAKGDSDRAISDYNEALRLKPNDAVVYNNRGNAWRAKGDYDRAISDYNEALRLDPKDPVAHNNRGWTKYLRIDYEGAISDYNEAMRLDPKYRNPKNNLAFLRATCSEGSLRDAAEALRLAELSLQQYPNNGYSWNAKACALAAQGDFAGAAEALKRAMEDPMWAKSKEVDGGKHAEARLAKWEAGELWTSDMADKPAASD